MGIVLSHEDGRVIYFLEGRAVIRFPDGQKFEWQGTDINGLFDDAIREGFLPVRNRVERES